MSEPIIQAQYDSLEEIAKRFDEQANSTEEASRYIIQMLAQLEGGGWEGDSAQAFFREMNDEVIPTTNNLRDAFTEAGETTRQIMQVVQTAEEEAANQFQINAESSVNSDSEQELSDGDKSKARNNLLNRLTRSETFRSGSVAHTTASDADSKIRNHIAEYVKDAVANGQQIKGNVAVVNDAEWDQAGIERYGKDVWESGKRDSINGFVDKEGRVWIHKDRGNPSTMIHEAIHKYSDNELIKHSQPLNEGVTEYFTRSVAQADSVPKIANRRNYEKNYRFVDALADMVGEDVVASAYFDGDMDGLRDAYIASGKSEDDWKKLLEHTRKNEWADATRLLTP